MAQKLKTALIILTSLFSLSILALPATASADPPLCVAPQVHPTTGDVNSCATPLKTGDCPASVTKSNTSGIDPNDLTKCDQPGNGCQGAASASTCLAENPIVKDLNLLVTVLSAGIGIVIVAMIIIGGIQYSVAGGSPDKVKEARKKIINALLAMVAFVLTYGFLQWIIPGGTFS